VEIRELNIAGAFEVTPRQFADDRGVFMESYRFDALAEAVGHAIDVRQVNTSVSRKGVVRGIHFADVPRGQAKYVTATRGAIMDYCIDIRVGSPTFGQWDAVRIDDVNRRSVYVSEGLGHAFVALTDDATVTYLVSDVFQPTREHGISPLDPAIGLTFDLPEAELIFSDKDAHAPTLAEAKDSGLLPTYDECLAWYASLNTGK
jgi:dTDP-4-dehydrorhamnose 3,5-epimerase